MAKFEKVSKYADNENVIIPTRSTKGAAGYDFYVAEQVVVPSILDIQTKLGPRMINPETSLKELEELTKIWNCRPTLVPTGIKCKLDPGTYLELSVRSSTPLKYWLILANSVGVIDEDYYGNETNEGHIFFQVINLAPKPILLIPGDKIGQGIIKPYLLTEDDYAAGVRKGGFGSTSIDLDPHVPLPGYKYYDNPLIQFDTAGKPLNYQEIGDFPKGPEITC